MCNPTIFFSLCLWDTASKSLVLPGTTDITGSRKNYKLFTSRLSLCTPGEMMPCLFWEDFMALVDQKPLIVESLAILNKRNVLMRQILPWRPSRDAMHPGTCRHCKNSFGQLRKLSFLCQYSTNWGIYGFNWLQLPSILTLHPHETWWIFPLSFAISKHKRK